MPIISTRKVVFAGAVAALYATLTMSLSFIGYGPIQFRLAEALCILPFFFPFTVWGLFAGCVIANLISPFPLDVLIGPLATLLAGLCTMLIGKARRPSSYAKALACLPPVIINAVFIGAMIAYYMTDASGARAFMIAYAAAGLEVGLGQLAVMYAIGLPLMVYLPRSGLYAKMSEFYGT